MQVEEWSIDRVKPYDRNARKIPQKAVEKVVMSIREYGWQQPIVVDSGGVVIAGHTRLAAAKQLEYETVPVCVASGLTPEQVRAYRLADNRVADETSWSKDLLSAELGALEALNVDLSLTGFDLDELFKPEDEDVEDLLDQSVQVTPEKEYILILCETAEEFEGLRARWEMSNVRRGGYKRGSQFDAVGPQRVIKAAEVLERLEASE